MHGFPVWVGLLFEYWPLVLGLLLGGIGQVAWIVMR